MGGCAGDEVVGRQMERAGERHQSAHGVVRGLLEEQM